MTSFFRVNAASRHVTSPTWSLGPDRTQAWDDLNLWVVDRGQGYVETPVGRIDLVPGTALILHGGTAYRFHNDLNRRIEHFWVHFDGLDEAGQPLPLDRVDVPGLHRRLYEFEFVRNLLTRLVLAQETPAADLWLSAVLQEVTRQDAEQRRAERADHGHRQAVHELCARIREQPHQRWTVYEMAEQIGCGPTHLARLFREHVGESPKQVVLAARFAAARYLLRDSSLRIGDIADQLGYSNIYFFSRQFRKHHGTSPAAYRAGKSGSIAQNDAADGDSP